MGRKDSQPTASWVNFCFSVVPRPAVALFVGLSDASLECMCVVEVFCIARTRGVANNNSGQCITPDPIAIISLQPLWLIQRNTDRLFRYSIIAV